METFDTGAGFSFGQDIPLPLVLPAAQVDSLSVDHRSAAVAAPCRGGVCYDAYDALAKRICEVTLVVVLLVLTAPLWLAVSLLLAAGIRLVTVEHRIGRRRRVIRLWVWHRRQDQNAAACCGAWTHLPALWNVLRGELALVGPRALTLHEARTVPPSQSWRYCVPPGLVGLYWLRRRANIDYATEFETDVEYARQRTWRGDAGIFLRALLASMYGDRGRSFPERFTVLGLPMANLSMEEAVQLVLRLAAGNSPTQVCFLNADCVNIAQRDSAYRQVIVQSRWNLGDGIGIKLAGTLLGTPLRQNLCGTELFPRLCNRLQGRPERLFLLGGAPGVAEDVAAWLGRTYPGVQVAGHHHGYFSAAEEPLVIEQIARSGAEILLVAMGAPRQELWLDRHLAACGAKVGLGVGGLFDVFAGRYPRPPVWVRELCLTWAYRVWLEPQRLWRRYLIGNGLFLVRVSREAMIRRLEAWRGPLRRAWSSNHRARSA